MTYVAPLHPNEALAELCRIKLHEVDFDVVVDTIANLAKRTIPGAGEASITLIQGDTPSTAAFTGDLARTLDESQYERGHGPCLAAAAGTAPVSVPDIGCDDRWPDWARIAQQAGVRSSLSIALPVHEHVAGALNIYATTPHAFDGAVRLAQSFADYAAVALANVHLYRTQATLAENMRKAMESRAVIEQAKGVIMSALRCSPAEAFAVLNKLSQDTNRKLRDVAAVLVARSSQPP